MPSRHRSREPRINSEHLAQVTDDDLKNLGALSLWALNYVNYIYDNGGYGRPMTKSNQLVFWTQGTFTPLDRFTAFSRTRTTLAEPKIFTPEARAEYQRQHKLGIALVLRTEKYKGGGANRTTVETVDLEIDADGRLARGGSYSWYGPDNVSPPAPWAKFDSLKEAHEATVSGRAAHLLGRFRDLVIDPTSGIDLRNIVNYSLSFVPPAELQAIPEL